MMRYDDVRTFDLNPIGRLLLLRGSFQWPILSLDVAKQSSGAA